MITAIGGRGDEDSFGIEHPQAHSFQPSKGSRSCEVWLRSAGPRAAPRYSPSPLAFAPDMPPPLFQHYNGIDFEEHRVDCKLGNGNHVQRQRRAEHFFTFLVSTSSLDMS